MTCYRFALTHTVCSFYLKSDCTSDVQAVRCHCYEFQTIAAGSLYFMGYLYSANEWTINMTQEQGLSIAPLGCKLTS